ncbi:hypothetical protein Bbelb_028240 [Branchiostoma belcheri]|nr:hypothetical protein Bbelb_028240 [Branchiostoma belcheri]
MSRETEDLKSIDGDVNQAYAFIVRRASSMELEINLPQGCTTHLHGAGSMEVSTTAPSPVRAIGAARASSMEELCRAPPWRLLVQPSALQSPSMEVARAALRDTRTELCARTNQFVGWRHRFSFL